MYFKILPKWTWCRVSFISIRKDFNCACRYNTFPCEIYVKTKILHKENGSLSLPHLKCRWRHFYLVIENTMNLWLNVLKFSIKLQNSQNRNIFIIQIVLRNMHMTMSLIFSHPNFQQLYYSQWDSSNKYISVSTWNILGTDNFPCMIFVILRIP